MMKELLKMGRKGHVKVKGVEYIVCWTPEVMACGVKPYRARRRKE